MTTAAGLRQSRDSPSVVLPAAVDASVFYPAVVDAVVFLTYVENTSVLTRCLRLART